MTLGKYIILDGKEYNENVKFDQNKVTYDFFDRYSYQYLTLTKF